MKRKPAWLKGHKLAPAGLVGAGASPRSTQIPTGPNLCNVECGACHHQGDLDDFKRDGFPDNEFHCPACGNTFAVTNGNAKRVIAVAGFHIATDAERFVISRDRPIIIVPAGRLQNGMWGLEEGDICAAYTADQKPKIRKPFEHEGILYANWGGSERDVRATSLMPFTLGADVCLHERQKGSYAGAIVTWKCQSYVCGEEVEFQAAPRGPAAEIDLTRRMYAYGGYFAANAGTYRNLMEQWMMDGRRTPLQHRLYALEAGANLPQTQEGMRALLGGVPDHTEPPRFNPWTGQTTA